MNPKTIFAVAHQPGDLARVLDVAVPLAQRFSAHLVGFHAEVVAMPQASPLGMPDVEFVRVSAEAAERNTAELKAAFEQRAARDGFSADWQTTDNFGGAGVRLAARAARACDLIVAQQSDSGTEYPNAETLLYESGRPVLLVPHSVPVNPAFPRVVVAWNGTREAARAAFDAIPFIVGAESVTVLCVDAASNDKEDGEVSGVDLVAALSRHGGNVTLVNETSAGIGVGETIENHLADNGADLLVMGAYSQSWLKEFFFGGATKTLMESLPTATLMSR